MSSQKFSTDFTTGSIPNQILIFTVPLYASNILQILYTVADMIIVGHVLGKVGLSAVSIGGDVANFLMFFATGFANAGQVIISQLLGAGKSRDLGRFIGNMMTFLFVLAVILTFVCLGFCEEILELMNTPPEALDEAYGFTAIIIGSLIFTYGYNAVSAILRGLGDSRHPFIFIGGAAVLNVILDIIFVIVIGMGARGAALATVISQGVSFIACVIFLSRNREQLGFSIAKFDFMNLDKKLLSGFVKLGLPMAIKNASVYISKIFVNSWINSYGVEVSAFAGIANKINSISFQLSQSLNTAGASMIGQNIGACMFGRVKKIMRMIFVIALTISGLMAATIVIFPQIIFGLFTHDPQILEIGYGYVPIAVVYFLSSACRSPMTSLINGCGNYLANFSTALFDGLVARIGLALLLGLGLGMHEWGFWLGDALAGFTSVIIGGILYYSGRWKKIST